MSEQKTYRRKYGSLSISYTIGAGKDTVFTGKGYSLEQIARELGRGKYFTIHEFENTDIPVYLRNADSNPAGLVFDYKMHLVKGKWVHTFKGFFRELCVRVDYGKRGFAEFPYNLSEAQSVMDQRDAIDRKGNWSLERYQFIHNCLLPSMSSVKCRIYNWFH